MNEQQLAKVNRKFIALTGMPLKTIVTSEGAFTVPEEPEADKPTVVEPTPS